MYPALGTQPCISDAPSRSKGSKSDSSKNVRITLLIPNTRILVER